MRRSSLEGEDVDIREELVSFARFYERLLPVADRGDRDL
jgi:hypothetical protein